MDHTSWKKPEPIIINTPIPKNWVLIKSENYSEPDFPPKLYYYNIKTKKSQWNKPIENVKGLEWTGNSCYLDSVLMCLFLIPNKFINDEILFKKNLKNKKCSPGRQKKIQKSLKKIVLSIRGTNTVKNCEDLRKQIKNCLNKYDQRFDSERTQDSGEFLSYLFELFEVETCTEDIQTQFKLELESEIVSTKNDKNKIHPIINIEEGGGGFNFDFKDITNFLNYIEETEIDDYKLEDGKEKKVTKITKTLYRDFPFIVFNYNRINERGQFLKTKIKAPETFININDGNEYELYGIVMHDGTNHYTSMLKLDDNWIYYNDSKDSGKTKNIGSYNKMINNKYNKVNPLTHGTLFFYKLR